MQKILVIGATSAIAQAALREWAKKPCAFYLIARDAAKLKVVAADLEARSRRVSGSCALDLDRLEQLQKTLVTAFEVLGGADVVLIAHGTLGEQRIDQADWSKSVQNLHTNLLSPLCLLSHLAPLMEAQGHGRIGVITSVAGDRGRQSNYIYGTAKGGLTLFLQGLRNRLHHKGVGVTTIKPGFVKSPMTEHLPQGPLFVAPETVARGLVKAMAKGKDVVYLPWFWRWIMLVIRWLPETLFKRLHL